MQRYRPSLPTNPDDHGADAEFCHDCSLLFLAVVLQVGIHLAELLAPFVISMTLIIRMLPMAVQIVNDLVNVDFARKSYEAVRESLERYQVMKDKEEKWKNRRKKQITLRKGIEIRNLTFGYQEDKRYLRMHLSIFRQEDPSRSSDSRAPARPPFSIWFLDF